MHNSYIQYLRSRISHQNTSFMHNLKSNYDKSFFAPKLVFENRINNFLNLIDRSIFNRGRKGLNPFIEELNKTVTSFLNEGADCFLVDLIPIHVCTDGREQRGRICNKRFETVPKKDILLQTAQQVACIMLI